MRIRFDDLFTPADLRAELSALLEDLESLGVEHIAWANLYFTPIVQSLPVELRTPDGEALNYVSVGG